MTDPNPIPFESWEPDKSDRADPGTEAKGVYSVAGQYAPFPDIQQYGPSSTIDSFTKVLLHMDGADATTTFYDDAPTSPAHTWTTNGNAQIDTADSKFGGASGLFDGTGDFVTTPDSADFTLGANDFTIDVWFKMNTAGGTTRCIAGQADAGFTAAASAWGLFKTAGDQIQFSLSTGAAFRSMFSVKQYTNTVNPGWHHLAVVRTGDVLKMFIDGAQEGNNISFTGAVNDSANGLTVGARDGGGANSWFGWLDEFRLSVGIARWTAGYATGNDAFTKLLPHMDGADAAVAFGDSALGTSTNHNWTAAGNAQVDTADSKFGGASGLFDGVGDQISIPDSTDLTLGSGDWTIECWFKCLAASGATAALFGQSDAGPTNAASSIYCQRNSSDVMRVFVSDGTNIYSITSATQFTNVTNTGWHHLAVVRNGNVLRMFIDGLQEGGDVAISVAVNDSAQDWVIGGRTSGATTTWNGWIDEFRLSVGIDRYSSLYAGRLPDSFTKLLVHGDGADTATVIADQGAAFAHVFTVAGNAQIDTAASKFGGASMLFDGAGDWWRTPDSSDLELGSGDFTIDFWFNVSSASGSFRVAIGKTNTASAGTNAERSYAVYRNNTTNSMRGNIFSGASSFAINGSFQVDSGFNTGWHHYALVRSGNNLWQFIDGSQDGQALTLASPTVNDLTGPLGIGSFGDEIANPWFGWLDEMRLSIGVARWSALAINGNDSFTRLLIHFSGPNNSTSLVSDEFASGMVNSKVFTVAGNAKIDTTDSKFGGSSGFFDGAGDWWTVPDTTDFTLGTSDLTIDFWFKCNAAGGTFQRIAGQNDNAFTVATRAFLFQRLTSNCIQFSLCNATTVFACTGDTEYTDVLNTGWHHCVGTRVNGDTMRLYIDGRLQGQFKHTATISVNNSANNLGIGAGGEVTGNPWTGWLDEFRMSVGVARWVPTPTADNDVFTKILMNFNGPDAGVSANMNDVNYGGSPRNWTVAGNAQLDTADFKYGTASLLLDGSGDWIQTGDHADFTLGDDDWTFECFFKLNTGLGSQLGLFGQTNSIGAVANTSVYVRRESAGTLTAVIGYNTSSVLFINGVFTILSNVDNPGWHHFALVKSSENAGTSGLASIYMFIDGVLEAGGTLPVTAVINDSANQFRIGSMGEITTQTWNGWIDEFRMSVGVARYPVTGVPFTPPTTGFNQTAMFTPPTAAYGGASFTPPSAAYYAGFSASLPASAFGADAATFTPPIVAYTYGGGAENIVQGADTFYDSSTAPHVFYGDAHRLYTLQSRLAADISKAGGYTVGSSDTWQFAQFGDNVAAVTASSAPQHYVMGTSVDFANMAGGPPNNATSVARVGDFLWMGKAYTVYWSAFNNCLDWAPSTVTQAGSQQLDQERGEIMTLIGLDYAAIFQERGVRRAIYVGSPVVWDFGQDYVEKARGCIARNAAMAFGRIIFYAADDGFYAFDGQQSTPIGYGKVDQYFTSNLNYAWRHKVCVGADYQKKIIVWAWPSGSAQLPTDLLIFSLLDGRWTHDVIDLEFLFDTPAEPVTVDNFNLLFPANNLDGSISPNDIDSAAFDDRRIRLGAFNRSHLMQLFTGSARAATMDTKEFEPQPGSRGLITEVWPMGEYNDPTALSTAIGRRKALPGEGVVFSNAKAINRAGYCPHRIDGRFLRIRQSITAGAVWRRAEGVHVTSTQTGKR